MKPYFILLSVLIATLPVYAAEVSEYTQIKYDSKIPRTVRQVMPKGSKSFFWGSFKSTDGKSRAIHVVSMPLNEDEVRQGNLIRDYQFATQIFEFVDARPMLLNTVPDTLGTSRSGPVRMGATVGWLDAGHAAPVLILNCFTKEHPYGLLGDMALLCFKQGWKSPPLVHLFSFGDSNAGGLTVEFNRAVNGNLQVHTTDSGNTGQYTRKIYEWNGHDLAFLKEQDGNFLDKQNQ